MVGVHTKVNVSYFELFTKSHIYIFCGIFYVGNTQKPLKLVMEQHLQDVAPNVMHNNNT